MPFIYASSSAVYGNQAIGIESGPVDFLHPYSVDKYILELYAKMSNKLYGLKSCGLRFFNVYGPYQDGSNPYAGVISIFIDNLLRNKNINIYGGEQTRDFIFVEDVVEALLLSYNHSLINNEAEIFNVLSDKVTSINELVNLIATFMGVTPTIKYKKLDKTDPLVSTGSAEYTTKKLGFSASTDITKGIELTINWMKSKIEK